MAGLITAIDPGNQESAWITIDNYFRPVRFAKQPNWHLILNIREGAFPDNVQAIEMIASYGMPVGAEVFETCVWIGRFQEAATLSDGRSPVAIKRHDVKMHHCHSAKAKDTNVKQALIDRFAPGERNHGKGTKAEPGWFYGFYRDIWQAYALAVYVADTGAVYS